MSIGFQYFLYNNNEKRAYKKTISTLIDCYGSMLDEMIKWIDKAA